MVISLQNEKKGLCVTGSKENTSVLNWNKIWTGGEGARYISRIARTLFQNASKKLISMTGIKNTEVITDGHVEL